MDGGKMTKDGINPDWELGLRMFNFNELVDALVGICGEEPTEAYKVESELIGEELKRRFKK